MEEELYQAAIRELRERGPREGLWAKAFAESKGNENQAKAQYLRWRVTELSLCAEKAKAEQINKSNIERAEENAKLNMIYEEEQKSMPFWRREKTKLLFFVVVLPLLLLFWGLFSRRNGS